MLLAARALMARPRLMLIDEISEGLQPSIISRLSNALGAERERGNVAMVLVEQNLSFALSIGSRAVREPTWTPIRISRRTGATYDHSHVLSAQEAFALFPSVNSGSSGARPLEGYLYEGKKGDQPCSEHGTAAASVDRGDGVDVKERNH